jgi:hypothetical protein
MKISVQHILLGVALLLISSISYCQTTNTVVMAKIDIDKMEGIIK